MDQLSRPRARRLAILGALALLVPLGAGCESAGPTPSPTPGTVSGAPNTNILLTGARRGTIVTTASCAVTPVNATMTAQLGRDVYVLEIAVDDAGAPGSFAAAVDGKASVTLSDATGQAWHSTGEGGSGSVSVSPDLRSGSIDAILANDADHSTVHATGPWKCGR